MKPPFLSPHRTILVLVLSALGIVVAEQKPNIVIFLADDQGWGDLSIHGNPNLATPSVDSLARDGAMFERFFVCPVCAPTRAEFLTGRYYPRTGVRGVSTGQERMNIDEVTVADCFLEAGYATGAFGKWHNGSQHPYHPNARGFQEYYGFTSGHWGNYFDSWLEHNGELTRGQGYITDDLTSRAIEFIEANREQPFFCYLAYNTPHSPMQVPDEFYNKVVERPIQAHHRDPELEDMPHLRAALAMCENIDWNVGRVLRKLDDLKLADNTIVIYFSDNGPNGYRWNGGMKGRKGSIDEGGVRSPFFIRWPDRIAPGKRVGKIAGAIDLLPTLTDLAGIGFTADKPIDGRSLKPLLLGQAPDWPDRAILSYRRGWGGKKNKKARGPAISVRNQQFRLDSSGQLFDLEADPGQHQNIAGNHPDIVAEMKSSAAAFLAELEGSGALQQDNRPFPVGYAEITFLPARDGVGHGGVQRSARAPNCSYFTNWTAAEDEITWDIELAETGAYEITLYYTCPAEDIGSTFELSFNGSALEGKVSEAHDPPLYGAEFDRTSNRGSESYVKDFRPMDLGTAEWTKGKGKLSLRALEIPGGQVMDIRLLRIRKL